MKFPREVIIGPFTVSVEMVSGMKCPMTTDAAFAPRHLKIHLPSDYNDQVVREVFLHEVEHAINMLCDLGDDSSEEDFVCRGTMARMSMLIDNPDIMILLMEMCRERSQAFRSRLVNWYNETFFERSEYDMSTISNDCEKTSGGRESQR